MGLRKVHWAHAQSTGRGGTSTVAGATVAVVVVQLKLWPHTHVTLEHPSPLTRLMLLRDVRGCVAMECVPTFMNSCSCNCVENAPVGALLDLRVSLGLFARLPFVEITGLAPEAVHLLAAQGLDAGVRQAVAQVQRAVALIVLHQLPQALEHRLHGGGT